MKRKWFLLRGLTREAGHWAGFVEKFREKFPDYEIITLDLPGAGVHFREKSPTTISGITDFMRQEFLQKKGEENCLFAVSLGAMVGMDWMSRYPEDFKGAILANTSMRGLSPFYHRMLPHNYLPIFKMFFAEPLAVEQKILEITSNRTERHAQLAQEWVELRNLRPMNKINVIRQLMAAASFRPPQKKPKPKILLLSSLSDHLVSPACSQKVSQHWEIACKTHPTAGHDITLDEPEWVLERVREF